MRGAGASAALRSAGGNGGSALCLDTIYDLGHCKILYLTFYGKCSIIMIQTELYVESVVASDRGAGKGKDY